VVVTKSAGRLETLKSQFSAVLFLERGTKFAIGLLLSVLPPVINFPAINFFLFVLSGRRGMHKPRSSEVL